MRDRSRLRRFARTVSAQQHGQRLDAVVLEWLTRELGSSLSKAAVRKLVMVGAIQVNGRMTRRAGELLRAGSHLEARVQLESVGRGRFPAAQPADGGDAATVPLAVLYEDDDLVAIAKPPGLAVHATADASRADLFSVVRRLLAARSASGQRADGLPYLGLHHRLDAGTSGVILFTKREAANSGLARQFAEGTVEKVYHALVVPRRGPAAQTWRVDNRLAPNGHGRRSRMEPVQSGGVRAVTSFRIARRNDRAWLVEAMPETGRKHQIRAHLAGGGTPILGDARYGGPTRLAGCAFARVMLHAFRLTLAHPVTGIPLAITAPYSPDFADAVACLVGSRPATISDR
ncbi:MAG: RluA family pseudouridine synthase [Bacteroidales bacterium]